MSLSIAYKKLLLESKGYEFEISNDIISYYYKPCDCSVAGFKNMDTCITEAYKEYYEVL